MPGTVKGQTLFDLSGGHPALDLVNSLDNRFRDDGPNENLVGYGELLRFLGESGLLDAEHIRLLNKGAHSDAAEHALRSVRELREATAGVFYAAIEERPPAPADIRILERHFIEASQHRELHWEPEAQNPRRPHAAASAPENGQARRHGHEHAHASLTWRWRPHEKDPNLPLWILSNSVSELLLSDNAARIRTCAVDTCRWLFLDTSKNHTRRWCNMKVCGNRMKARRFQARRES
jgi:predicted RNA-binding Zn ribbon-like protein